MCNIEFTQKFIIFPFVLDFLEAFHIHKNHNNIVNCDFAVPSLSGWWKSYIYLISADSSFIFKLKKYLSILFSFWSISWLLLFIFGSSDKLYRAESCISLFTEDFMLNITETAVCNF